MLSLKSTVDSHAQMERGLWCGMCWDVCAEDHLRLSVRHIQGDVDGCQCHKEMLDDGTILD